MFLYDETVQKFPKIGRLNRYTTNMGALDKKKSQIRKKHFSETPMQTPMDLCALSFLTWTQGPSPFSTAQAVPTSSPENSILQEPEELPLS